jgi:hypothetical protein
VPFCSSMFDTEVQANDPVLVVAGVQKLLTNRAYCLRFI